MLVEPPKNYTDAKNAVRFKFLRHFHIDHSYQALVRDGYRCVITGFVDYATMEEYPNKLGELDVSALRGTNCAHILAWSTSRDINTKGAKVNYSLPLRCIVSLTCRLCSTTMLHLRGP